MTDSMFIKEEVTPFRMRYKKTIAPYSYPGLSSTPAFVEMRIMERQVVSVRKKTIDSEVILALVCSWFKVTPELLNGRGRDKSRIEARMAFYWLCRKYTNLSSREMATILGTNHDHSTVLNAVRRCTALMEANDPFGSNMKAFLDTIS